MIFDLKETFGTVIFNIHSYDLDRQISKYKEHTELWNKFWEDKNKINFFSVRLNPEIRIFYRQKQIIENPKKQKNRFSKNQYSVAFTITQNAAQTRQEASFLDEKELLTMLDKFNDKVIGDFISQQNDNFYYYGIDRGTMELATLCVVKFSKVQYEAIVAAGEVKKFEIPIFPPIVAYKIKDDCLNKIKKIVVDNKGKETEVTAFQSPSYFIGDENILEQVSSPFIDLTTAKLINGKIILNGDTATYIALKKANAKRKLFEIFPHISPQAKVEFNEKESRFTIRLKQGSHNDYQWLCFYHSQQDLIYPKEKMIKELQGYLENIRSENNYEEITLERINHLRDAVASNMVGIIAFLFEKYKGIINLENLHSKNEIERHFRKNNENISRRLEWSLYKKFQKYGLVPPHLRQTVFLREKQEQKNPIRQFGIIHFIPKEGTSTNCPYCGEVTKKDDTLKYEQHRYICKDGCGFDTNNPKEPMKQIKNADSVAAYNIAKKKI